MSEPEFVFAVKGLVHRYRKVWSSGCWGDRCTGDCDLCQLADAMDELRGLVARLQSTEKRSA